MLIALLMTLVLAATSSGLAAEPKVGEKAPDFSLPDNDGGTFTLSAQRKTTVVVFYPRAFTGG